MDDYNNANTFLYVGRCHFNSFTFEFLALVENLAKGQRQSRNTISK